MKLKEYQRPRKSVGKTCLANPIFDNYTADELNKHMKHLLELEIKAIKKEFVIEFGEEYNGIVHYEKIYLDEHEVKKILNEVDAKAKKENI
ncbi:MAG: hypothetical protein ACRCWQ_09955 [Bacilli bacterium]